MACFLTFLTFVQCSSLVLDVRATVILGVMQGNLDTQLGLMKQFLYVRRQIYSDIGSCDATTLINSDSDYWPTDVMELIYINLGSDVTKLHLDRI